MTDPQFFGLRGEGFKEPFHYTACGLDNIFLVNGYKVRETREGKAIAIKQLDRLLRAIGIALTQHKKTLSGKELRFLRIQMGLTQSELGRLLSYSAQQVARWEKEESNIPGPPERLIRMLYQEHLGEVIRIKELLEVLDELDGRISDNQFFEIEHDQWRPAEAA